MSFIKVTEYSELLGPQGVVLIRKNDIKLVHWNSSAEDRAASFIEFYDKERLLYVYETVADIENLLAE
jgi:hypothetical protein